MNPGTITHETISPGFEKFHLNPDGAQPWPFRPVLHHFQPHDIGEEPHDHPHGFQVFVLRGSYLEEVFTLLPDGGWSMTLHRRETASVRQVAATDIHRIVGLPDGDCWTLVLAGPVERDWRFWRFDAGGATPGPPIPSNWKVNSP